MRARTQATQFYVSENSLERLEKSKCQTFISVLISVNYLALYIVILLPFYLIFKERLKDTNYSKELNACLDEGKSQLDCEDLVNHEEVKTVSALQQNAEIGVINIAVLLYSLLCELIMIMA